MSQVSNTEARQDSPTLTARSVVLSVLLGTDPPRLPVQLLVRTTELFGIAEGTTRTALSRMREAGEVTAEDGWYEITGARLLARQARQSASREAQTSAWKERRRDEPSSGAWVQALVAPERRRAPAARAALRAALAEARLSELREGVWLRPDNLAVRPEVPPDLAGDLVWFGSTLLDDDPAALAGRLWDLPGWANRAEQLLDRIGDLIDPLNRHDRSMLAQGFVLSADVLRHFQADPLLPADLLPGEWPGERLRRTYDTYDAAYRTVLREWFAEQT